MAFVSKDAVERFTRWAEEDIEVLTAELAAARKLARMGERLTVLESITARWDAWSKCPVCFPWRGEAGEEHTCNLSPAERNEAAQLDISKHGDRHEKLVNEIGAAHRAWMEVRG